MPSPSIVAVMTFACLLICPIVGFMIYVIIRYSPIVARIFEEKPMFLPLRAARTQDGEDVRFPTRKGLLLAGTYLKTRSASRSGVLVFCHEYLGDRWSALPYLDHLRDHGFDILTFDFRNHGESDKDPNYNPLQWVTNHEVDDLQAAIAYLKSRPDSDPAGFALFGVSRGGGTALCVGAKERSAWGVITDGAFPTRGTMVAYIYRWAEIYVASPRFWYFMPKVLFEYLGWTGRMRTQLRLGCRYSNVEGAVARLAPRPWLAIHGEKDAYIGLAIAKKLFERAGEPKELWVVPMAKHNRCREKEPTSYNRHLVRFFERYAPRRMNKLQVPTAHEGVTSGSSYLSTTADFDAIVVSNEVPAPISS